MAPKRPASAAKKTGRPAKVQKGVVEPVDAIIEKPVDPIIEKAKCALDLLNEFETGLPASCVEMMRGALPLALASFKDNRHDYQNSVIKQFEGVCETVQNQCQETVTTAEEAVETHKKEQETSATRLEEAQKEEVLKVQCQTTACEELTKARGEMASSVEILDIAKKAATDAEDACKAAVEEKQEFESRITEHWAPLKEGTFEGKDWRARNKFITKTIGFFKVAGSPESLIAALNLALKDKPDVRTPFSVKAIEYGEECLQTYIASLGENIALTEATKITTAEAVTTAEASTEAAATLQTAAEDTDMTAQNTWLEANEAVRKLKAAIQNFDTELVNLNCELELKKATQSHFFELLQKFVAIREAMPEPEPVPEQAVEQETEKKAETMEVEKEVTKEVAAEKPVEVSPEVIASVGA